MSKQAVILAGGKGSRLGERVLHTPKPLLTVAGQPFINILVEELIRFGFDDIIILCGTYYKKYDEWCATFLKRCPYISLVPEQQPMGTAGSLHCAAEKLESEFLFVNGDSFFGFNLLDLVLRGLENDFDVTIALRCVEDTSRYGAVQVKENVIVNFGEKITRSRGLINGGAYMIKRRILENIPNRNCSLEKEILPAAVRRRAVAGYEYKGNFIDIGIPDDLIRADKVLGKWLHRPAAFLDRDGTINCDHGYVHRQEDIEWIQGVLPAIKLLNDSGYLVFVVTNQAGIARGFFSRTDVEKLHIWMNARFFASGAHVDRFYYCPHHPTAGSGKYTVSCDCRKPKGGMLRTALSEWSVDKNRSFLIGDKETDVAAARDADIKGFLFDGKNLHSAVKKILQKLG